MHRLRERLVGEDLEDGAWSIGLKAVSIARRHADTLTLRLVELENLGRELWRGVLPIIDLDKSQCEGALDAVEPLPLVLMSMPAAYDTLIGVVDNVAPTHTLEVEVVQRAYLTTMILKYLPLDDANITHSSTLNGFRAP